MFEHLPLKADLCQHTGKGQDEGWETIIPAQHTRTDFLNAAAHVTANKDVYGYTDDYDVAEQAFHIWQHEMEDGRYIRPDVLVATLRWTIEAHLEDFITDLTWHVRQDQSRKFSDWLNYQTRHIPQKQERQ
jgi:hypothetical protein